jgi:hypothetical protein
MMIQRLVSCGKARSQFHDLYDDASQHRIEVKFSRALKQAESRISEETILRCIEEAVSANRLVPFSNWQRFDFDCNIQQVKRAEFDVLYYGVFFSDCVVIFRICSDEIGPLIQYSDKQHKGNVGEGQFHINPDTLSVHLDKYLYRKLTYNELYDLLS